MDVSSYPSPCHTPPRFGTLGARMEGLRVRVEASRAGRMRRSGLGFGAAFLTGMLVLLVVSVVAGLIFVLTPGGTNSVAATFLKAQPGSIRWDGHTPLKVLLMGLKGSG